MSISSKTAAPLPVGHTFQNEKYRVHRYRPNLEVTDIRFAGQRGKVCESFNVFPTSKNQGDSDKWFDRISDMFLDYANSSNPYASCVSLITDLQHDYPGEISLDEQKLKSINVEPFGEKFEWKAESPPDVTTKGKFRARVSPHDFGFVCSHLLKNGSYMDTLYSPRSKKDAQIFYGFMKSDKGRLVGKYLNSVALMALFRELGVDFDSQ